VGEEEAGGGLMATMVFALFIACEPRGKGRHRTTKGGRSYPDPKTVRAEEYVKMAVSQAWKGAPMDEPLAVRIIAYSLKSKSKSKKVLYPTGKPDWDNQGKLICDSLNGVLWRDDAIIVDGGLKKRYCHPGRPQPGFLLEVFTLGEEDL
jgi:Holliday junction resolvase RusA-like endonuclease